MASEGLPSVLPVTDCGAKAPPRTEGLVNRSPFFGNTHLAHSNMVGFSGFSSVEFSVQNKASVWRAWSTTESIRTSPRETPSAELADTCERNKACAKRDVQHVRGRAPAHSLHAKSRCPRAWLTAVLPPLPPARTFLNSSCRPLSPRASGGLTTTAGGVRGCSSSHSAVTCASSPFVQSHSCPTVAVHTLMMR